MPERPSFRSAAWRRGGVFAQFFLALWGALLILGLVAWVVGQRYQTVPANLGDIENNRAAERSCTTASQILRVAGRPTLLRWLNDAQANSRPKVFVVDPEGREISGRVIPEKALASLTRAQDDSFVVRPCWDEGDLRLVPAGAAPAAGLTCSELRFFAVRDELPPRNVLSILWHTPWWLHLLFALLAVGLVALLMAWRFTLPVRQLNQAMRRVAEGDLSVRVAADVGHRFDEIGAMARGFDHMAERISDLLIRQQRLFHDVSHELRSPLARIGLAVALAGKDRDRLPELLARIDRDVTTLDTLVGQILTLARLGDPEALSFESADLILIINDVVDNASFEGAERGIRFASDMPASLPWVVDRESLSRALENVVRNALRFSPPDGVIEVTVKDGADEVAISIGDQGPGLPEEALEHVFRPFARISGQTAGSGFGLGLAIARRAVRLHGGTIKAVNRAGGGLLLTLSLPSRRG